MPLPGLDHIALGRDAQGTAEEGVEVALPGVTPGWATTTASMSGRGLSHRGGFLHDLAAISCPRRIDPGLVLMDLRTAAYPTIAAPVMIRISPPQSTVPMDRNEVLILS